MLIALFKLTIVAIFQNYVEKLKAIFNEAGAFRGLIYVLMLKLSASLTKKNGLAPGGEFRRALKEVNDLYPSKIRISSGL